MANIEEAQAKGYTIPVLLEGGCETIEGLIKRNTNLDSTYWVFDVDAGGYVKVSGWNVECHFEHSADSLLMA